MARYSFVQFIGNLRGELTSCDHQTVFKVSAVKVVVGSKCIRNSGFSLNCVLIYSGVFYDICQVDIDLLCVQEVRL